MAHCCCDCVDEKTQNEKNRNRIINRPKMKYVRQVASDACFFFLLLSPHLCTTGGDCPWKNARASKT